MKQGKINILISTDVCARGLHMKRLRYVVNYDFPPSIEQYAHRIGRVGRQGVVGEAYSLITRNMAPLVPSLVNLLKTYDQIIEPNLQSLAEETLVLNDDDDNNDNNKDEDNNNDNSGEEDDAVNDNNDDEDENNNNDMQVDDE